MTQAAIYIRWSTDDQADGTTLELQLEACRAFLVSQGWACQPERIYIDDGYSGGTLDRPALTRLRAAVQHGEIDCVVVFKLDRLSRNVVDTVNLVLREWEGKCHVRSAREAIDTATQQGRIFFYTLVSFAEWERSVIRERTWAGRMQRLREGRNPGFRPPYGLRTGAAPGAFATVAEEVDVVQRIFGLYARGLGYKAIAVALGEAGIRFRGGRPWSAQTVAAVLRNPLYAGRLVYGEEAVESARLPTVIDPGAFAEVQALRAKRALVRAPARAAASEHLLTGLLRCGRCGAAMMGRKRYGGGNAALYYICTGQRARGTAYCDCGYIRQDLLDAQVTDLLVARYGELVGRERYLNEVAEQRDLLVTALAEAERELTGLERELAVIGRDYRQERLAAEAFAEQRAVVAAEQARVGARAAELRRRLAGLASGQALPAPAPAATWAALPPAKRKQVVRQLVARLAVYRAPGSALAEAELTWASAGGDPQQE